MATIYRGYRLRLAEGRWYAPLYQSLGVGSLAQMRARIDHEWSRGWNQIEAQPPRGWIEVEAD